MSSVFGKAYLTEYASGEAIYLKYTLLNPPTSEDLPALSQEFESKGYHIFSSSNTGEITLVCERNSTIITLTYYSEGSDYIEVIASPNKYSP